MGTFLKTLVISILLVFAPIKAVLLTTFALVFVDLIAGIWAAVQRGEKITSSGLKRTLIKLFVYEVAVMAAFLCETYLTGAIVPLSKIVSGFVGLTELKSLIESLNELSGGSVLKGLVEKLGSVKDKEDKS